MVGPCILPFSKCPYLKPISKQCSDLQDGPYNSDAKCYRLPGKKKMLIRAKVELIDNDPS